MMFSQKGKVCNGFEITFVSEKQVTSKLSVSTESYYYCYISVCTITRTYPFRIRVSMSKDSC